METMKFLKSEYRVVDAGIYWKIIPAEKREEESIEVDYYEKVRDLLEKYSSAIGIPLSVIASPLRKHEIALARQCAIYFLFSTTPFTYKTIASYFSERDHATIIHSKDVIASVLSINNNIPHKDKPVIKKYLDVLNMIWSN